MKEVKFSRKYYPLFLVIPLSSLLYYIKRMDSIEVVLSFILYVAVSFILMVLLWEFISLIDSRYDKDSWCSIDKGEIFVRGMHIS